MRIKRTNVYKYAELSDAAKATARDWYRNAGAGDNFFAESVTDDFHETLKAFGFDPYRYTGRHDIGTKSKRSTVEWSGFSSQGDGAAFAGTWHASDFAPRALLADRPIAFGEPGSTLEVSKENAELHRIAAELRECVNAGMTSASIDASGRGFFMSLSNWGGEAPCGTDLEDYAERFIEAARDLARGFYRALEAEWEYQNSDDCVAENIVANEYEFTEDGERA